METYTDRHTAGENRGTTCTDRYATVAYATVAYVTVAYVTVAR